MKARLRFLPIHLLPSRLSAANEWRRVSAVEAEFLNRSSSLAHSPH